MSRVSTGWLERREPHDAKARNPTVLQAVAAAFSDHPSLAIVDLGCGTGAMMRAVSPLLPRWQNWRLTDNDLSLLARVASAVSAAGKNVATIPIDLARDLEMALDGPIDLVTASAFLDLTSAEWIERLAVEVAARGLPIYASLTDDGRATLDPPDPRDAKILEAVHRHQCCDQGFGPALGPKAAAAAIARFQNVGYDVIQGTSDWTLGPQDGAMQTDIFAGWAAAARADTDLSEDIVDWLTRRRGHIDSGRSSIRLGHIDFFARPTRAR
ncbi:MAG: SAM-dependent methyltransferase [Xanthobacteraceae bacterium]